MNICNSFDEWLNCITSQAAKYGIDGVFIKHYEDHDNKKFYFGFISKEGWWVIDSQKVFMQLSNMLKSTKENDLLNALGLAVEKALNIGVNKFDIKVNININ